MKSKHTKGNFYIRKNQLGRTELWVDGDVEDTLTVIHNETVFGETEANAQLIADSFNVTNETGLTPKELQKSHSELLDALEKCLEATRELNGEFQEGWDKEIEQAQQAIENAKP